jgi:3-oxoadipate enol-lactonase
MPIAVTRPYPERNTNGSVPSSERAPALRFGLRTKGPWSMTQAGRPFHLPEGRILALPGRGTTHLRESEGPPGAPTVVLIHGLTMTADLNWFGAFSALARHFHVVALDLRGHGRGMHAGWGFRLEDCADDVAALVRTLGLGRVIVVGYSMGGLVAQLLWRRHRTLVDGLVLCATARNFRGSIAERLIGLFWPAVGIAAQMTPLLHLVGAHLVGASLLGPIEDAALRQWAHREMARTSMATLAAAIDAVSEFTSHDWIGAVDVPTAVIVTTLDGIVPASRQLKLASAIPGAVLHEIQADHGVCVRAPAAFARELLNACRSVCAGRFPGSEMVISDLA